MSNLLLFNIYMYLFNRCSDAQIKGIIEEIGHVTGRPRSNSILPEIQRSAFDLETGVRGLFSPDNWTAFGKSIVACIAFVTTLNAISLQIKWL
jgi:hypothetical protein